MQEDSSFSTSSPASVVARVVNFSHSDWFEVISQGGFDLYFLIMSDVEHLSCVCGPSGCLLWKMSIHVFCPFLCWIICFSGVEFGKFFIDFGYSLSDVICKYLLPFCRLPFSLVDCFLCCAEAFYLDEVSIVHFCFCFPCLQRHVEYEVAAA